jgi:hypothetical protein
MTPPAERVSDKSSFTMYNPVVEPVLLRKMLKGGIYGIGGQYAILMQFAHSGLARGSAEHSDFASRILSRLKTTTRFSLPLCMARKKKRRQSSPLLVKGEWLLRRRSRTPQMDSCHSFYVLCCRPRDLYWQNVRGHEAKTVQRISNFRNIPPHAS